MGEGLLPDPILYGASDSGVDPPVGHSSTVGSRVLPTAQRLFGITLRLKGGDTSQHQDPNASPKPSADPNPDLSPTPQFTQPWAQPRAPSPIASGFAIGVFSAAHPMLL